MKSRISKWWFSLVTIILVLGIASCAPQQGNSESSSDVQTPQNPVNTQPTPKANSLPSGVPASIVQFSSANEGEINRFYFQIQDGGGNRLTPAGEADFKIMDTADNILYEDKFSVASSDFVDYQFVLTGQGIGKVYEWRVPYSEMEKGVYQYGKAELVFRSQGKELKAIDAFVEVPFYSEEELVELREKEFAMGAVAVDKSLKKGAFEIILEKAGYFTPVSALGEPTEQFRMDMVVKSISQKPEYFSPSGLALLDDQGNQYDSEYGGSLDTYAQIHPGVKKSGYLLFQAPPKSSKELKLVFEAGYDANYRGIRYEFPVTMP